MSIKNAVTSCGYLPLKDRLLVDIVDKGERKTQAGIILPDDDFKDWGIRARWARVVGIGGEAIEYGIELGDYVLLEHGDWSRSLPDAHGNKVWMTTVHKCIARTREFHA